MCMGEDQIGETYCMCVHLFLGGREGGREGGLFPDIDKRIVVFIVY